MNLILKNWLGLFFLLSIFAIGSALVAEHFFNLAPCKMCLKQRHTYYAIIPLISVFYFFNQKNNIWLHILNEVAILYGLFYALWHVGIEKNILQGPTSCSGILSKTNSLQNLKEQISNQAIVSCSDVSWSILGFSAASINSLLLLFILTFNTIFIVSNFYEAKKNN
jgi:disulfide bond formation protein DsbB